MVIVFETRSFQENPGEQKSAEFAIRCPRDSALIPSTGFSLSEDVDTTPGFIFTEYDLDLRVLRGCYEGLKTPKKVTNN